MSGFYESYLTLFPNLCALLPLLHQVWLGSSFYRSTLPVFIVLLSAAVCFPSFTHVTNFSIVPDSVEYASSAHSLLLSGTPLISIGDTSYPSRYPFGFSLFVVLPGIIAGSFAHGAEILFITIYTVVGVVCCYLLGNKLAGPLAGIFSVTLLLLLPSYVLSSQELLTYSPSAGLGLLLLFLSYRSSEEPYSRFLTVGIAASLLLAVACRPLSVLLALPVIVWSVIHNRGKIVTLLLSLIPTIVLLGCYFIFNSHFFDSPFRSGYSYWSSIPYDFPKLILNVSYLRNNIGPCINTLGLIIVLAGCSIKFYKRDPLADLLLLSFLLFGLPLIVFHLFYFYSGAFFFLQSGTIVIPIVGAMLARMLSPYLTARSFSTAIALLFLVGCVQRFSVQLRINSSHTRQKLANEATSTIPSGSVLISGMDPLSFALLSHGENEITIIPKSRNVEYASKFIVPMKPLGISADGIPPRNHRDKILLTAGAQEVLPLTALEDMPLLKKTMEKGTAVYFETVTKDELTLEALRAHFVLTKVSEHLYLIGLPLRDNLLDESR